MDKTEQVIKLQKLVKLFTQLESVDKNALANLEKLVQMAKTNPGKYNLALKFL